MICVFLGAGFSVVGGVPLASQLFDEEPTVDRITRQRLVARVLEGWSRWQSKTKQQPEEYLAHLEFEGGKAWLDAKWYVSLVIALKMGRVEYVGAKSTIIHHNIDRTSGIIAHEKFWSAIFSATDDVTVITTNYDILAERGMRNAPRSRIPRPGFHYGSGPEPLAGGGYPSYAHIKKIAVTGRIPLLKLHGSVSWGFRKGGLTRYHDCRPAIRGDAAIVAPVIEKSIPTFLEPLWLQAAHSLSISKKCIFVGYSFPQYDILINNLFVQNVAEDAQIHIINPDPTAAQIAEKLLRGRSVSHHPGLPDCLSEMPHIMTS